MPKKLPPELETSIIRSILSPLQSPSDFGRLCNSFPDLYGTPGSQRRKSVTNRKSNLTKKRRENPNDFNSICQKLGIVTDEVQQEGAEDEQDDEQEEETDEEEESCFGKIIMNKNYRSVKPEFLDDDEEEPDRKRKYSIRWIDRK